MKKLLIVLFLLALVAQNLFAQTNVSGGIYSNTTWTKANSPYIVTDTVVVFPNVTLTIQPGVTVKFMDSLLLQVRGTLIADGTASDSITFTSNSSSPKMNIYGGITLDAGRFSYCNFYYGYYGISGTATYIRNSSFKYNESGFEGSFTNIDSSNFVGNYMGVYRYSNTEGYINACNFLNNNTGLTADGNTLITLCNFYNNGTGLTIGNDTVQNCLIERNTNGIRFIEYDNFNIYYYLEGLIENCTINSNINGVNASQVISGDVLTYIINHCKIDSNTVGYLNPPNQYGPALLLDSVFFSEIQNNGQGIELSPNEETNLFIKGDIIQYNSIGIADSGSLGGYCNKIGNNTTYDFINGTPSNFNFSDNYWNTTDSATIAAHIYDGYDNVHLGLVTFMPIDTSKCYLSGCNLSLSASVVNATCDTCHNGSATVHIANGSGPYTITWYTSPLQTTATATHMAPGTYSVCVIDANGCSACYGGVHVDSTNCGHIVLSTTATNATCTTCSDGAAWLGVSGGTAPYHYTWYSNPLQSTDTATALGQGKYQVCVSDKYGCAACDSVTVGTGNCSAFFNLYPDPSVQHHYFATNMASGAAPIHYLWSWGDGSTDTIALPRHTYAGPGYYTICLTITDAVGCTNTHCVSYYLMRMDDDNSILSVDVISNVATGTASVNAQTRFYAYPNPASGTLNLIMATGNNPTGIKVYNMLGVEEINSIQTGLKASLDISALASGIYIVEFLSGSNISRQQFVKK